MKGILIAGIGNIFLGDDAFGVHVAQRLLQRGVRDGVRVVDFGIRSVDLIYALLDGYDAVILVDATPRGGEPGTLYAIEPDLTKMGPDPVEMEAHSMNPVTVLRAAKAMGGELDNILLIGCEPETLGPEEGLLGLSACVEAAVEQALLVVDSLVEELVMEKLQYLQREV